MRKTRMMHRMRISRKSAVKRVSWLKSKVGRLKRREVMMEILKERKRLGRLRRCVSVRCCFDCC